MIIGIDGNEANQKIRVGSGIYAFELLKQFHKLMPKGVKFKVYLKDEPLADLPQEEESFEYIVVGPKKLWTQFRLPIKLWYEKIIGKVPDVFFSPTHYAPRFCPIPSVITIFDLSYIRFPELFFKNDLYQLKSWTEYSVRQAKKIITISQFSKNEIVDYYKVDKNKVIVAYPGFNADRFNIKLKNQTLRINNIKDKFKIDGDYILYIGTIQPRKNLERLIKAFQNLKNNQLKLVIAGMINEGRGGWMQEEIIKDNGRNIIVTGYVDAADLPYLISAAKAFVLPSLYEGFGIPVVEAMASGVPVVVSNTSSLPEVSGDAGILVDPHNPDSISEGIKEACYNKSRREEMIRMGLVQAEKFSWERSAKIILDTLQSVIHDRN